MNRPSEFLSAELSEDIFKKLLPDFFKEIEADFSSMEIALANKEINELRLLAHKMKGTSSSYGGYLISEDSLLLQKCIDKNNFDKLKECLKQLSISIFQTKEFARTRYGVS